MKVICYGDSNTYGYDPRSYFGGQYDAGWVKILTTKTGWNIINQGENGREIPKTTVRFPADTDLLIIMLGTNDLLQYGDPEVTCERMERFVCSLNLEMNKILLIAPPPVTLGEWVQGTELIEKSALLTEFYQDLALRFGIYFLDAGKWNVTMAFDGVHFTEKGHKIFADELYCFVHNENYFTCKEND